MDNYKLKGEFGDVFFTGNLYQCQMVKGAMIKYGILERKIHIIHPKNYDYKMPESLKYEVASIVVNCIADDAISAHENAQDEVFEMSDMELHDTYVELYHHEEDILITKLEMALASYEAEKVLLEE